MASSSLAGSKWPASRLLKISQRLHISLDRPLAFQSDLLEKPTQSKDPSSIVGLQNGRFCITRSLMMCFFLSHMLENV